jgi:hypothetical protein
MKWSGRIVSPENLGERRRGRTPGVFDELAVRVPEAVAGLATAHELHRIALRSVRLRSANLEPVSQSRPPAREASVMSRVRCVRRQRCFIRSSICCSLRTASPNGIDHCSCG